MDILINISPNTAYKVICKGADAVLLRKILPVVHTEQDRVFIYVGKTKQSVMQVPKQYRPLIRKFMGRVIGVVKPLKVEQVYKSDFTGENLLQDHLQITDDECSAFMQEKQRSSILYFNNNEVEIFKPILLDEFYRIAMQNRQYFLTELKTVMSWEYVVRK